MSDGMALDDYGRTAMHVHDMVCYGLCAMCSWMVKHECKQCNRMDALVSFSSNLFGILRCYIPPPLHSHVPVCLPTTLLSLGSYGWELTGNNYNYEWIDWAFLTTFVTYNDLVPCKWKNGYHNMRIHNFLLDTQISRHYGIKSVSCRLSAQLSVNHLEASLVW
jgi:hypothetical protein